LSYLSPDWSPGLTAASPPDLSGDAKKAQASDPVGDATARNKDREDARVKYDEKTQAKIDAMRANASGAKAAGQTQSLEELLKNPPKNEDLPPPPVMKNTDPVNVWGSLAMLAAAIGGARTHTPAITALNAAAEVMKGVHEGDKENYDQAFERWKAANDNLLKSMTYQVNIYKAIMSGGLGMAKVGIAQENADTRVDVAELAAQSRSFGNDRLTQLLEMRDIEGAQKMIEDMEKTKIKLEQEAGKVGESKALTDQLSELHQSEEYRGASSYTKLKMDIDALQTVAPHLNDRGSGSDKDRKLAKLVYDQEYKDPSQPNGRKVDAPDPDKWYKETWPSEKYDSPLHKPETAAPALAPGAVVSHPDGSHTKLKEGGDPDKPEDWEPAQLKPGGDPTNDADWQPAPHPTLLQKLFGGSGAAAAEAPEFTPGP